jgi:hypothetical protein
MARLKPATDVPVISANLPLTLDQAFQLRDTWLRESGQDRVTILSNGGVEIIALELTE